MRGGSGAFDTGANLISLGARGLPTLRPGLHLVALRIYPLSLVRGRLAIPLQRDRPGDERQTGGRGAVRRGRAGIGAGIQRSCVRQRQWQRRQFRVLYARCGAQLEDRPVDAPARPGLLGHRPSDAQSGQSGRRYGNPAPELLGRRHRLAPDGRHQFVGAPGWRVCGRTEHAKSCNADDGEAVSHAWFDCLCFLTTTFASENTNGPT